mgnify:CR=1 FL=1
MRWLGQNIYDQVSRFRHDVYIESNKAGTGGNLYVYNPVNDGSPTISLGSSATEKFEIKAIYDTGAQTLKNVIFKTFAASGTADKGTMYFQVDETTVGSFNDSGLNMAESTNIGFAGVQILSDSSGTTTLKNIDALDATTVSTFNSALTAGDITGVTAGTNLSGGGTSGTVTINLATATDSVLGAASFNSDNFDVDTGSVTIAEGGVTFGNFAAGTVVLESERIANNDNDTTIPTSAAVFDHVAGVTGTNITQVGTIGTGTWQGTVIDKSYTKHLMHYRFMGYGTGDGTNYFSAAQFTDAQSPWEHNDQSSSDGLTIPAGSGTNISELIRSGGHVMIANVTLTRWTGWITCNGSAAAYVALFKWTPVDDDSTSITPVLLDQVTVTAAGNDKARSFAETSFTQASVSAGDIIFTQIKTAAASKTVYFNSTLEVVF